MGARASVSFKDTNNNESITIFSHWGGADLALEARLYLAELKQDIQNEKVNPITPLARLDLQTIVIDFIRHLTKNNTRIESNLYLGKDEVDGDNSDFGHTAINLDDYGNKQ